MPVGLKQVAEFEWQMSRNSGAVWGSSGTAVVLPFMTSLDEGLKESLIIRLVLFEGFSVVYTEVQLEWFLDRWALIEEPKSLRLKNKGWKRSFCKVNSICSESRRFKQILFLYHWSQHWQLSSWSQFFFWYWLCTDCWALVWVGFWYCFVGLF